MFRAYNTRPITQMPPPPSPGPISSWQSETLSPLNTNPPPAPQALAPPWCFPSLWRRGLQGPQGHGPHNLCLIVTGFLQSASRPPGSSTKMDSEASFILLTCSVHMPHMLFGGLLFSLSKISRELSRSVETHITHFKWLCNIPVNGGARINWLVVSSPFQTTPWETSMHMCKAMHSYKGTC